MAAKGEAHGASEPWHSRNARLRKPISKPDLCSEDSALKLISPKHVRNAFHRVLAKPRLALPPALLFASRLPAVWHGPPVPTSQAKKAAETVFSIELKSLNLRSSKSSLELRKWRNQGTSKSGLETVGYLHVVS